MRSKQVAISFSNLLRECYHRPHRLCLSQTRSYASGKISNASAPKIAVLGGGISGLTSAYILSQKLPNATITLFESNDRLGGWLQTTEVDTGNGRVLFEQGPRTLRPTNDASGWAAFDLIRRLRLEDSLLLTPKNSPAARNRFIYYPDHLVKMPGPGQSLLDMIFRVFREPAFSGLSSGILQEVLRPPRPENLTDESVGHFFSRRVGSSVADNLVSGVLHGIYAGDVYQLSVRSLFPLAWLYEKLYGSIANSVFHERHAQAPLSRKQDLQFLRLLGQNWNCPDGQLRPELRHFKDIQKYSVYTFRAGLGQLWATLKDELTAAKNITVRLGTTAEPIAMQRTDPTQKVKLKIGEEVAVFDHVISSFIPGEVARSPNIKAIPKATVMVVNLHYPSESLLPVNGFGYLIPRSISINQNPERALGVVFDSDAIQGQDTAKGTKLTVMMGGHWWQDWPSYPDEQQGLKMARSVVERHLGIRDEPDAWKVTLQKDCIPQYHVGHNDNLVKVSESLKEKFQGRLRVVGASFHGVSVNDCIKSGHMAAEAIAQGEKGTGLEGVEPEFVRSLA